MIFCIPIAGAVLSLGQTQWKLDKRELEIVGFIIEAYSDKPSCQSTYEVYVQVPKRFKGQIFMVPALL